MRLVIGAAGMVLCVAHTATPSHAAMRICQPVVSGGLQAAPSKPESQKMAMAAWVKATAAQFGQAYTSWRLAVGKHFACAQGDDRQFRCLAKAEPCTIQHKPPLPGTLGPRKPKGIDS